MSNDTSEPAAPVTFSFFMLKRVSTVELTEIPSPSFRLIDSFTENLTRDEAMSSESLEQRVGNFYERRFPQWDTVDLTQIMVLMSGIVPTTIVAVSSWVAAQHLLRWIHFPERMGLPNN